MAANKVCANNLALWNQQLRYLAQVKSKHTRADASMLLAYEGSIMLAVE